jgi:hypothetical protein
MKTHLWNWIQSYTNWIIVILLAIGIFVALIASEIVLPLTLIIAALALAIVRYWQAIKTFDFWALDEWFHARLNSIGVREWHAPYRAAEYFCNPTVVKVRNEAAAEMNTIMMELIRGQNTNIDGPASTDLSAPRHPPETNPEKGSFARRRDTYDAAQIRHNQCNAALARELVALLAQDHLIAKGMLVRNDIAHSERIIPTSRWRILKFDISKAEASAQGLNYTGIVIGKKPVPAKKLEPAVTQS